MKGGRIAFCINQELKRANLRHINTDLWNDYILEANADALCLRYRQLVFIKEKVRKAVYSKKSMEAVITTLELNF